jgi:hypothetical protein
MSATRGAATNLLAVFECLKIMPNWGRNSGVFYINVGKQAAFYTMRANESFL